MPRGRWLILIAICLLIAPIGFAVGRWSGAAPGTAAGRNQRLRPDAGVEHKKSGPGEAKDYASVTIENLGQVEFDQAFDLLHSAPKEALRAWTKRLEELPVGPRRTAGLTAFFKTLAQIDTSTAVDLALSLKRHDPRWNAIAAIANATPAANLDQVARMYIALNEKKLGLNDFVRSWSRSDPLATAEFLSSYTGDLENDDFAALMANWAALDPGAARDWLAKQHPVRRDEAVYASFYSGWLEHDRGAALNDLRTHLDDQTFQKALKAVSLDLFKESREAARAFLLTLPPAAQETGVNAVAGDVTAVYLSGAPDLSAKEVAEWLLTLPETLWKGNVGEIVSRWDEAVRDSWIDQLAPGTRDAVLADYCRAYSFYTPTDSIRAGFKIRDPDRRRETFRKIFDELEGGAREELLAKIELSPEETQELSRILERP